MSEKSVPQIVDLASAFYGSAVLFAALDLGVFKAIEEAGGSSELFPLADELGVSPRGLRLLLDACVATGILGKEEEVYFNTSAGKAALVPGGPADLSKAIRYNQDVYPLWGRLAEDWRTRGAAAGSPRRRSRAHTPICTVDARKGACHWTRRRADA